jgi:hypothetical protein
MKKKKEPNIFLTVSPISMHIQIITHKSNGFETDLHLPIAVSKADLK